MPEHQNVEYKESWRDEYLKWVCGFANAQGGKIFIGIDDKGKTKGVADYKKLMEEIPNKVVSHLGLVVDVNLRTKMKKHYIEISFKSSDVPISLQDLVNKNLIKQEEKSGRAVKYRLKK